MNVPLLFLFFIYEKRIKNMEKNQVKETVGSYDGEIVSICN
jgi:hypothetical protein